MKRNNGLDGAIQFGTNFPHYVRLTLVEAKYFTLELLQPSDMRPNHWIRTSIVQTDDREQLLALRQEIDRLLAEATL